MQHGIAGDGIILGIAALHGRHITTECRLAAQDVVHLERQGKGLAAQEGVRQLCIPYQFIGVHRLVVVSATTIHIDARREGRTPGSRQLQVGTVGECPCVEVVVGLQLTAGMQILQRTIQFKLQPVVTVAGCQALTDSGRAGGRLLRRGLIHGTLRIGAHIADAVDIAQRGKGVDVEIAGRVDGGIEHKHTECIPVTVDVLRPRNTRTGLLVIGHHIRHRVVGCREIQVSHDAALVVLYVVIIEQTEVLRERRLQSWVTLTDIQRVGIVGDVQQVGHGRLTGRAAVSESQLADLRNLPAEVGRWRPVHHTTLRHRIGGQIAVGQL